MKRLTPKGYKQKLSKQKLYSRVDWYDWERRDIERLRKGKSK